VIDSIEQIAKQLVRPGKGILAADESIRTANKRLKERGISENEEMRRLWRQLLFTTEGIEAGLSGIILYDETIRQSDDSGTPFVEILKTKGIITGIKVDEGTEKIEGLDGEMYTKGLDGLRERLVEYRERGAKFTKWRGVFSINTEAQLPTQEAIDVNAEIFAEYALVCQEEGFVPIVEPEVLLKGTHTIDECAEATERVLAGVFQALKDKGVNLQGMILKTGMVLPGSESKQMVSSSEIAQATVRVLQAVVPQEVAGVVFLSGGQTSIQATENLNELSKLETPWPLTFSYSRALQTPVMDAWGGKDENVLKAQEIFKGRVDATVAALSGTYERNMEPEGVVE